MIPSSNEITEIATDKIDLTKDKYTLDQNQIQKIAKKFMKEEIGFKMKATKTNENTSIYIGKNKENKRTDAFEFVGNNLSIERVKTVYDSANRPIAHIINFSPKGYCVMSATLKYNPVLSFSSENKFEEEKVSQPEALWWIEKFNLIVHLLNDTNYIIPPEVTNNWMFYGLSDTLVTFNKSLNNDINKTTFNVVKKTNTSNSECRTIEYIAWNSVLLSSSTDTIESVGPLMTTSWGQRGNYNNFCPNLNCGFVCDEYTTVLDNEDPYYDNDPNNPKLVSQCIRGHYNLGYNGRALVGCVAVAVGQLMKYWFRNSSSQDIWKSQSSWGERNGRVNFNFRDMPDKIYGYNPDNLNHNALNRLLADIGVGVGMEYECDASTSPNTSNIEQLFGQNLYSFLERNNFILDNYNSVGELLLGFTNYDFNNIRSNIRINSPVLLSAASIENAHDVNLFFFTLFTYYTYSGRHLWVADGYRKIRVTNEMYYTPIINTAIACDGYDIPFEERNMGSMPQPYYYTEESTTEYLHHNWGWDDRNNSNSPNRLNWHIGNTQQASRNTNFQYKKRMITLHR